jgi:DNA-binding NarL/FixJ family response regulator
MKQLDALMLVEDNSLFQDMFESAIECLNTPVILDIQQFSDKAEEKYKELIRRDKKPKIIFLDINLEGSSFNGLELLRRINFEYGNEVIVGMISTSEDEVEIAKAVKNGALFWIKKSGDLEEILPRFFEDIPEYEKRTKEFTIYK